MAYTTIDDPSAYFQTALYTGNGTSTNAITNDGNSDLKPDWLWLKARSILADNIIFDSTRGTNKRLSTNTTGAEATQAYYSSFDTDGFTLGDSNANVNQNGTTYVNWQWKANGGTTVSNTDGSITSTVQADTTAGFSIVSFTGDGSTSTVGHGLGVAPKFFIIKSRSAVENWWTYTTVIDGSLDFLYLNNTNAKTDSGLSLPTSSVFSVNSSVAPTSENIIAYCFAEKQGYSKFGSYTGTGNADGPMVFCGLKPAWLMIKRINSTGSWLIWDTKRTPYNVTGTVLYANDSSAEETYSSYNLDFLSNGFKIRGTDVYTNASGGTYIYMAFAEHPFVSSEGVPTTAS